MPNEGYQHTPHNVASGKGSVEYMLVLCSATNNIIDMIIETKVITCKRGSAKHCVQDDPAFLWKHTIFGHLAAPVKPKPRNRSI
jgi:hypothetical protein